MAWLVAGLGNPGDRYATSRHNLGRMVVEELAREEGERFRKARFLPAEIAEIHHGGERVLLVRSTHFMNESGPSFAGVTKKQDIEPANEGPDSFMKWVDLTSRTRSPPWWISAISAGRNRALRNRSRSSRASASATMRPRL